MPCSIHSKALLLQSEQRKKNSSCLPSQKDKILFVKLDFIMFQRIVKKYLVSIVNVSCEPKLMESDFFLLKNQCRDFTLLCATAQVKLVSWNSDMALTSTILFLDCSLTVPTLAV